MQWLTSGFRCIFFSLFSFWKKCMLKFSREDLLKFCIEVHVRILCWHKESLGILKCFQINKPGWPSNNINTTSSLPFVCEHTARAKRSYCERTKNRVVKHSIKLKHSSQAALWWVSESFCSQRFCSRAKLGVDKNNLNSLRTNILYFYKEKPSSQKKQQD